MTDKTESRQAWLPPRWFIRSAWVVHRWIYNPTGGRRGLKILTESEWGMMRLYSRTHRGSRDPLGASHGAKVA
jgi:hypothetical protein